MNSLDDNINLIDLVKKAQFGCQESMDNLAQRAQRALFAYIYRLTLNYYITEDLQQETLLEMVKSLKTLEHPERFWAWLYRTALGKVQHYFRDRKYQKIIRPMSTLDKEKLLQRVSGSYSDGLKNLINKELSQAIVDAMAKLKLRHRNILVLRCFEKMPYSQIAEIMDCSEMAAQVLFFRAKQSLKRQLSRHGFGKGILLGALGLFAQMTAPADAAPVTLSAASTKVGLAATVIGVAGTKLALTIATMITATALTVSSITLLNNTDGIAGFGGSKLPNRSEVKSFHYVEQRGYNKTGSPNPNLARDRSLGAWEQWYYFPEGIEGPMFMMAQKWDPQQKRKLDSWLHNDSGNYYYHSEKKIVLIINRRSIKEFSPVCFPTDSPDFIDFLNQTQGRVIGFTFLNQTQDSGITYTRDQETNLVIAVLDNRFYNARNFKSSISYNKLNEKSFDSFHYPWPKKAPIVDLRDEMHKRGWTYFRISGEINGEKVQGRGQIPFIYNTLAEHPPWMKLKIGNRLRITDSDFGAYLAAANGNLVATYPAGSFFKGLARPWMGMHAIDSIRRVAAEKRIKFSTQELDYNENRARYEKAVVTLFGQADHGQFHLRYTINMDKDVTEKIEFLVDDNFGNSKQGVLRFTYLEKLEQLTEEFTAPTKINVKKGKHHDSRGVLWLIELAQGTLGK